MKPITKKELLLKQYEMACHNLLCYSANYAMTEPSFGFEKEHKQAAEECEILKAMMDEYAGSYSDKIKFIGTVSSWEAEVSRADKEHFIKTLVVSDKNDNHRMFTIDYDSGKKLMKSYDTERHLRYDEGKDTEIIFTVNNSSQQVEHWEWKVK